MLFCLLNTQTPFDAISDMVFSLSRVRHKQNNGNCERESLESCHQMIQPEKNDAAFCVASFKNPDYKLPTSHER